MKILLLIQLLFITQLLTAQSFTEATPMPPFEGAYVSVDVADVNGDGYLDVLITGGVAKLYLNDSMGNYTEKIGTPFPEVFASDAAFSDVNNDGHPDVFIMGIVAGPEAISKLYINDGLGNFTEKLTPDVIGINTGYLAFEDVDGDGDQDLLTVGCTGADFISPGDYVSILYLNDGSGNFTEKENTPYEGVVYSYRAFADVNGNGHKDVFISGDQDGPDSGCKLYINDGLGNFTEKNDVPFSSLEQGVAAFADFNGNGHMDVVIGGTQTRFSRFTTLYINDGTGNFTEKTSTTFDEVSEGSIAVADANQDGHLDVFIMGRGRDRVSKLYLNDGEANFSEVSGTSFETLREGEAVFADVNSDDYLDLFIIGESENGNPETKLYVNDAMVSSLNRSISDQDAHFKLYPNPSRANEFFIEYHTDNLSTITLSLYDVNGVQVSQKQETAWPGTHSYTVSAAGLHSGSYILVLNDGNSRRSRTVIIE